MKLLIAGGGTGGHILAGVAIADIWCERSGIGGEKNSVLFVGAEGGIEEKLVPRSGHRLELLRVGSLNRVSLSRKVKTLFQLPLSILRSGWILFKFKPQFVLGVGGYSSGPLVLTAWILKSFRLCKLRTAILGQNPVPGLTNRILGRFSDLVFVAFPGTESQFPNRKVVVTGNPVRSTMKPMPAAERNPFTVFIFGGSQGAIGINSLVLDALPHLADMSQVRDRLRFIHQTGDKDYDRVKEGYEKVDVFKSNQVRVEKFVYDMPSAYAEASLLICRAGSSTLAEVAAVGRTAVLIPLPTSADNHQERNARIFTDAGAAILLLQQNSQGGDLARIIGELVENSELLTPMEKKVVQFFRPKAAEDIVNTLSSFESRN